MSKELKVIIAIIIAVAILGYLESIRAARGDVVEVRKNITMAWGYKGPRVKPAPITDPEAISTFMQLRFIGWSKCEAGEEC